MAEERLDRSDVVVGLQEMGCKGVAEGVGGNPLQDTAVFHCSIQSFLYGFFVQVISFMGRGITYEKKGLVDQALIDYNRAIELQPNYALAWMNRGNVFSGKNQFDQALADYNKALAMDPNYAVTYYNLAQLYAKKNDLNETCTWLERYAKFDNVDYESLRHDKEFDRFRNTPCYKKILSGK